MSELVSVIIPTYNREKFLSYALESVKNQTYKNWELIIVDDGSTDNTEEICRSFAKTVEQPVKYIYQENQGVAGARNTGLKSAKGEFIAFLDSDDRWYPWHLKKCLNILTLKPDIDFIFAAGRKINFFTKKILIRHNFFAENKPHPILSLPAEKVKNFAYFISNKINKDILAVGLPSGLQCMIFRKKSVEGLIFPQELKIAEDRYFIYRLILQKKRIGYLLSVNVLRFVHDNHLSGEKIETWKKAEFIASNLIRCYKSLLQFADRDERKILRNKIAEFYINYLSVALLGQRKKGEAIIAILNGIKENPFKFFYYKTLLSTILK